jgi:hypothetical protein
MMKRVRVRVMMEENRIRGTTEGSRVRKTMEGSRVRASTKVKTNESLLPNSDSFLFDLDEALCFWS